MRQDNPGLSMFEFQNLDWDTATDVPIDPVVINDWYVALVPTPNVKAYYLVVEQTNNGGTDETLELEATINGTIYTASINTASGVERNLIFNINAVLDDVASRTQMLAFDADQSAPLETRSLGIRVRQTTVVDLVSAIIDVNLVYAQKTLT